MSLDKTVHQKPVQAGRIDQRRGEAESLPVRDEVLAARDDQDDSGRACLLSQALTRENLLVAWKRVKANKGSAGVDGLSMSDTIEHLQTHWPHIRSDLLSGEYRPAPVRRVQIPKPGGGQRELGIPTVTDRLIQQALLQVLQPILDPTFSDHSYGFRPGRRAHDAVLSAQRYVQEGFRVVVDVDLETFFDRVNHDVLMHRLSRRIEDKAVLRLVRRYLQAGVMHNGVARRRDAGTPQGGPLSPLLANVLLDEVDRELERRGHRFVRYADDCNVYVRSHKAGERVLGGLRKIYSQLDLKVNEKKTTVSSAFNHKLLGFSLWLSPEGQVKRVVAVASISTFKRRIRQLTQRNCGRSLSQVAKELRRFLLGWKAYFRLAQSSWRFRKLDEWLRHRLRALQLKHWKRGPTTFRELRRMDVPCDVARRIASHAGRWWHSSRYSLNL
ncbi:MAG: group II intron reverse transcriptase/maturase, partial [Gammaproteobacteria bacterium]